MGRGRPAGTFKYQDKEGKPISIYEWRRSLGDRRNKIEFYIPEKYTKLLEKLSIRNNLSRNEIARKIVMKYFDEKAKKEVD